MSKYLDRFKMASCPFEARWFFVSNEIGTYLSALWSQKSKENMPQNNRLQRNGRQSPKSDDDMNDSCVKTRQYGERIFLFRPQPRTASKCAVF